uniref:G_PROTEIN_RECEP_F1_2 domain-containing protein n=1 Tax=Syphacia muris TaxID=451379 RepID=A0A0N5A917_9BILA
MVDCQPYWKANPDPSMHPVIISIFTTLYALIFVSGFVGNVAVLVVTFKNRSLQSVQNIFLLNLAASDILMCLLSIPVTPVTLIMKEWYFGGIACKTVSFIQALGVFVSTFSLCAIAIDRYIRIIIAPGKPLQRKQAFHITYVIWILSAVVSLPYVYPDICGVFCIEQWPNERARHVFTFSVLLIQFVIPLTILSICYHSIMTCFNAVMFDRDLLFKLLHLSKRRMLLWRQKKRLTTLLIATVAIFGFTALTNNISSIIFDYDTDATFLVINGHDFFYLVNLFTHW